MYNFTNDIALQKSIPATDYNITEHQKTLASILDEKPDSTINVLYNLFYKELKDYELCTYFRNPHLIQENNDTLVMELSNFNKKKVLVCKTVTEETSILALEQEFIIGHHVNHLLAFSCINFMATLGLRYMPITIVNDNRVISFDYASKNAIKFPHIFTAYVQGPTLHKCLATINAKNFLDIYLQIILALEHAQNTCKFVHYDLHSNNIIITCYRKNYTYVRSNGDHIKVDSNYLPILIDYGISYLEVDGKAYTVDPSRYRNLDLGNRFKPYVDIYHLTCIIARNVLSHNNIAVINILRKIMYFFNQKDSLESIVDVQEKLFYNYMLDVPGTISTFVDYFLAECKVTYEVKNPSLSSEIYFTTTLTNILANFGIALQGKKIEDMKYIRVYPQSYAGIKFLNEDNILPTFNLQSYFLHDLEKLHNKYIQVYKDTNLLNMIEFIYYWRLISTVSKLYDYEENLVEFVEKHFSDKIAIYQKALEYID